MKKKDGGIIKNWQVHNLSYSKEQMEKLYPGKNAKPMVFTGTVVEDPVGRWLPGYHMRSSCIISIDREKGIIETVKTIYKVQNEGNDIIPDMGNGVLEIFY